jgi:tetratricopeptide (TPR) repeat protein
MKGRNVVAALLEANELRDESRSKGKHAVFVKNLKQAIVLYENVVPEMEHPSHLLQVIASCHFRLASLEPNREKESFQEAVDRMKLAIKYEPDNGRLHAGLADKYEWLLTDYDNAAVEYRTATELSPDDIWILKAAARQHSYPDSPVTLNEAIYWLKRAVELDPDDPVSHAQLASYYHKAGQHEDAKKQAMLALTCPQPLTGGWVDDLRKILDAGD